MVNKFLIQMAIEYATRAGKSVYNATQRILNSQGASNTGFGKAAQQTMSRFVNKPMTREEACKILSIEEKAENPADLNPAEVMERFETLFEKNLPEKGGSFYLQSKIYFAKEHLMQDFPPTLNASKYNPSPSESKESKNKEEESSNEKK